MGKKVKMKTSRGAAKRFRQTASGKYKYRRSFRNHMLRRRSESKKRQQRQSGLTNNAEMHRVAQLLRHK